MGRGRAKAKQAKVARELKYHSPNTDLDALQRELAGNGNSVTPDEVIEDDGYDKYSSYASEDEDDDPSWAQRK
jgi:hypothetical protein